MERVVIVDYGMGNLRSVSQAVQVAAEGLRVSVHLAHSPSDVRAADRIILPGQGAMPDCMAHLRDSGMMTPLLEAARNKPLFGVCVGMQMLLTGSHETSTPLTSEPPPRATPALGLLEGEVVRFALSGRVQADGSRYKVPHMGWNRVRQCRGPSSGLPKEKPHALWHGVPDESYFYFVHSFYAQCANAHDVVGWAHYGEWFACAIARENLFATQFHPEKSAQQGLQLYRNFLTWKP